MQAQLRRTSSWCTAASSMAAAADPAARRRVLVPGPGQVPRLLHRRCARRARSVHGRLAGSVGVDALGGTITEAAWRSKPSWYLLTTEDRMIPPPAQQTMSGRAGATNRGRGQPLRLCVAACSGSRPRQTGRVRGGRTAVVPASFSPTRRTASVAELLVPSAVRVVTAVTQSPAAYAGSQVC
jgi:hypothetical protein